MKIPENALTNGLTVLKTDLKTFQFCSAKIYLDLLETLVEEKLLNKPDFFSEKFYWLQNFQMGKLPTKIISDRGAVVTKEVILQSIKRLKRTNNHIRMLDIGCGPVTILARRMISAKECEGVECIGVDPLASFYKTIHARYQTGYSLNCVKGTAEQLCDYFKNEEFDIVISENAIDHCVNPCLFFENMSAVTKTNGILIIGGYIKEGSREGWRGLHKWDVEFIDSDLVISNQDRTILKRSLSSKLKLSLLFADLKSDRYILTYIKH